MMRTGPGGYTGRDLGLAFADGCVGLLLLCFALRGVAIIVALALAFWLGVAVAQQPVCMPAAALAEHLRSHFGELPAFDFQSPDEKQGRFYANAITGTWTIVLVREDADCVVQSGKGFAPPTKPKAPTL